MRNMLSYIPVFLLVTFTSSSALGSSGNEIGIKGGMNIASIDPNDHEIYNESKLGFVGGVFFTRHLSDNFGIQLEILYTEKGARRQETISGNVYDISFHWDYIELPALLILSLPVKELFSINPYAGITFSLNTDAVMSGTIDGTCIDQGIRGDTCRYRLEGATELITECPSASII
jgi:hypothetical protein